ncbi:mitochondrial 54S ribosomal protein YmL9 [Stemphylium lycopersici]|uniref:Large ribosomal subunit protein uL3m n=1 Tax=Stemphylium lycopersici TaxID=183478 RepID=A0A364MTI3_STELY|nr:50s ribosomal protein l3 [Stemphylium lycopersici]RAR02991.1 mitochondrial 54S ribosomal protein YmL9 [Stemphylium lycopersici]RAR04530.1 mitochondrial 54S ribosomal protein YmL9 [Stemphylium lycopersici]
MPPKAPLNWGLLPPSFLLPSAARCLLQQNAQISRPAIAYTSIRTIKSTFKPKPDRFAHHPAKTALNSTSTAALERKAHSTPLRTGLLAIKKGMTSMYDQETGKRTACTVLQLDRNEVVAHKRREKNGYWAVQIGAGQKEARNVTRPMLGHFAGAGLSPKRWVAEFKVRDEAGLQVAIGQTVGANWFTQGQWVDVKAISRGMGFAGGMKRHGFGGQPASHGQSLMHRGMGSAGGSQGSGSRVLPGKRMPGNMGNESVTVKNLKVLQIDEQNGIVVVTGCVPGPKNQIIRVSDALGKPWPKGPMTTAELVAPQALAEAVVPDAAEATTSA